MRSVPSISPSRSSAVSRVCESDRRAIASPTTAEQRAAPLELEPGFARPFRRPERVSRADCEARELSQAPLVRSAAGREPELQRTERRLTELKRDAAPPCGGGLAPRSSRCSSRIAWATRFRSRIGLRADRTRRRSRASPPRSRQRRPRLRLTRSQPAARRAAAASSSGDGRARASPATSSGPPTSRPIAAPSSHSRVASQARSPASIATLRRLAVERSSAAGEPERAGTSLGVERHSETVGARCRAVQRTSSMPGLDRLAPKPSISAASAARRRPDEPGNERAVTFGQPDALRSSAPAPWIAASADLPSPRIESSAPPSCESTAGPRERGERTRRRRRECRSSRRGRRGARPHARS